MINRGKVKSLRWWSKWANSGAVDFAILAKSKGVAIFNYDPILGCPFDNSQMEMVNEDAGFKIGDKVIFKGMNHIGTMIFPMVKGRVVAIGKNAKYFNGVVFTAIAVQVGGKILFKTQRDVRLYDKSDVKKKIERLAAVA